MGGQIFPGGMGGGFGGMGLPGFGGGMGGFGGGFGGGGMPGPPSQTVVPRAEGGAATMGDTGRPYNQPMFYDRIQTPWGQRMVERSMPFTGERMQGPWRAGNRPPGGWWNEMADRGHAPLVARAKPKLPWWKRVGRGALAGLGTNVGQGRQSFANIFRGGLGGFFNNNIRF